MSNFGHKIHEHFGKFLDLMTDSALTLLIGKIPKDRETERSRKAENQLQALYDRRHELMIGDLIKELQLIHRDFSGIPSHYTGRDGSRQIPLLFFIMGLIAESQQLKPEHVRELAAMLFWREIREKVCGARISILKAVERFPHAELIPELRLHQDWLVNEIMKYESPGTHFYADLSSEIKFTEKLIARCEAAS